MKEGKIAKVSGPLVVAEGLENAKMYDLVRVGKEKLMGEIIELRGNTASIQVYEETEGLGPGDPVENTGEPLSVELGPGLLQSIYDGVQRPLEVLMEKTGNFMHRGIEAPGIAREKKWPFKATASKGEKVVEGGIIGTVQETTIIEHKIMVPPGVSGTLTDIKSGDFTVEDTIAVVKSDDGKEHKLNMIQRWPVRKARPYKEKLPPKAPLITGQRVVDTFFPIAQGGTACVPGPFGSGKTVIQHQFARWSDAQIIIFIGCGERGNEMTEVLIDFPELIDPYTGEPLMKRTVLIANTSNMPVAAREASVYTGITIAEYFRDMGYSVALQADSTSRWAEAMREISGRLEEMPGEEGFPAYLGTRLASFYERAGKIKCLGSDDREGAVTVIGSVSPPGGDLSEPVVQNTLRVVKVFWGLVDWLAYQRHFPAIDWLISYSLYLDTIKQYWRKEVDPEFEELHDEAMAILQRESELKEIVRLVGVDALSTNERLVMEAAKSVREDFLQQHAYHPDDTFTSLKKQYLLLKLVLTFHHKATEAVKHGLELKVILDAPVRERIAKAKYIPEEKLDEFSQIENEITEQLKAPSRVSEAAGTAQSSGGGE